MDKLIVSLTQFANPFNKLRKDFFTMELILKTMTDILDNSDGAWITNNHNIEGDHTEIFLTNEEDEQLLRIEYGDEDCLIKYSDIITVLFQDHGGMKIFEIKIKDAETLLLHIRYK